jgi:hypothetical protein
VVEEAVDCRIAVLCRMLAEGIEKVLVWNEKRLPKWRDAGQVLRMLAGGGVYQHLVLQSEDAAGSVLELADCCSWDLKLEQCCADTRMEIE